jgi:hypothetical protein
MVLYYKLKSPRDLFTDLFEWAAYIHGIHAMLSSIGISTSMDKVFSILICQGHVLNTVHLFDKGDVSLQS